MTRRVSVIALFMAAGCVAPKEGPPLPPPAVPTPPPAQPAPVADWSEAPVAPGTWRWAPGAARFAAPDGTVRAAVTCAGGQVTIARALTPGPLPAALVLRATTTARSVAASASGPMIAARLMATDPILDALIFSRGRFAIEAGADRLILPPWPEIARVVDDCRQP